MSSQRQIEEGLARVESLLQSVEGVADPALRDQMREIVSTILDYHGGALTRILEIVRQEAPPRLLEQLAADKLIGSLLLLYDLHPDDCATRIERALDEVRPYLLSHKGNVSLVGSADGVAQLRMHGSCHGCPSSAATLKNMIEDAVYAAAPEIASIELVNEDETQAALPASGFVPIAALSATPAKVEV